MSDNYDDGLVHGHRWATEPTMPMPIIASVLSESDNTAFLDANAFGAPASIDGYDDGLVHGHMWAAQPLDR
jgi:hypothetical protein